MAEKILYLLGAGASAQALPLVKANPNNMNAPMTLTAAMRKMAEDLKATNNYIIKTLEQATFYARVADDMIFFANEGDRHTTIDTYAKYLYLTGSNNYERLKFVLSIYFTLEQVHNKKLDKRYLIWLVSLMENALFPANVKILSWNYDFQIELSAEVFRKESFSKVGGATRRRPPVIEYYPPIGMPWARDIHEVSLLHLNGLAGFYQYDDNNDFHAFLEHENNKNRAYLDKFMQIGNYNKLNFAWEKNRQKRPLEIIQHMATDVTILVVIGYSFPFFNREMDMEIYKALSQKGKLKKIYFQDPNRDGSFMRNQFGYGKDVDIFHVKDTDALYIPFEL